MLLLDQRRFWGGGGELLALGGAENEEGKVGFFEVRRLRWVKDDWLLISTVFKHIMSLSAEQ